MRKKSVVVCCNTTANVSTPSRTLVLTKREKEVVEQMLMGATNREIAIALSISVKTVEFHLSNIYAKLGVDSRAMAVANVMALDSLS